MAAGRGISKMRILGMVELGAALGGCASSSERGHLSFGGEVVILLEVKDLQMPPLKVNQYEKSIDGIRPIGNPRANYWIRPGATLALSRLLRWNNLHRLQSRQQPVSVDLYLSRRQLGPVFSLRSPFWSRGLPAADSLTRKPGTGTASRIASLHPRGDTGRADDACAD